jgi:flagellar hook-basal body complex protein FliE
MSDVGIDRVLAEMRRLAAQTESLGVDAASKSADGQSFAALLEASIDKVNVAQTSASEMATAFERGDGGVSLPEVMIALQKASLSFQAMTEVRNRLVTAYQEIMNMPI